MKKLPTLRAARKFSWQSFGVLALVALLLTVSYWSTMRPDSTVSEIPAARVPIDAITPPIAPHVETESPPTVLPTVSVVSSQTSFESYRSELTASREKASTLLDEVIFSASASADTVQEALRQKAELARTSQVEAAIETLLKARGFPEVLCTVRSGSVNVVVRAEKLTQQQAAQILDIAVSESGEPAANVRIIPAQ